MVVTWAADSAVQTLFNAVSHKVANSVKNFPRYTCVQTIVRSQFQLPRAGSSCASAIANNDRNADSAVLLWHDRLRLDVAVGEKSEMYSWAGATQFEGGDISQLIGNGTSGSGEFGSFLVSVFGGDAQGFRYESTKETPAGKLAMFSFVVPIAKSHYQYSASKNTRATIGYKGSFLADPETADLRELDVQTEEFPPLEGVCRVEDKIQYGQMKIGENSFMLPRTASMDVVYRNSTESLNETTFSGCREYGVESSISFDVDENGNPLSAARKAELKPVPPKTHLRVRISPEINSDKAAAGDPIVGMITAAVKEKNETIVRAGDKLHGRIVRLEQTMGASPRWTVAILFQTLERNGTEEKISLKPVDDGDRSPSGCLAGGGRRGFGISPANNAPSITSERPVGGGIFSFAEPGNLILGQRFESEWETR